MKLKLDFVSNSSSTSFVYISDEQLTEEAFLKAAGVLPNSPVASIFVQMHTKLCRSIEHGKKLNSKHQVDDLAHKEGFTSAVLERMKNALDSGKNVVVGSLSSEEDLAEMILCTEMFQIDSDEFFINAYMSYW